MTIDANELRTLQKHIKEFGGCGQEQALFLIAELKEAREEHDAACALLRSADAMIAALTSPNNPHVNDLRARIVARMEKRP